MKKSTRVFVLASILAFSVTSLFALEAKVVSAKGKTEVQMADGAWTPLKIGSTIQKGAVIQTGFKSELILKIKETTVTVAPLSRITVEQLAEKGDKDDTRLFLDTGSLKSDVKKTVDRRVGFTVRSPVATASVRGTIVGVTNRFKSTDVKGYEGSIAVWKAPKGGAKAEVAAEGEAPTPAVTGNDPAAVSDGQSGAGAILVRPGQTVSYTTTTTTTAKENAQKQAVDVEGTKTLADTAASEGTVSPKQTGATVIINVNFGSGVQGVPQ